MLEEHVAVERTEEWNTVANQDGNEADSDLIDQTGVEKGLHGDPAVDIDVLDTLLGEVFEDLLGLARRDADLPLQACRNLSTTMGHSTGLIREQCPVW